MNELTNIYSIMKNDGVISRICKILQSAINIGHHTLGLKHFKEQVNFFLYNIMDIMKTGVTLNKIIIIC